MAAASRIERGVLPSVETSNTLLPQDASESTTETVGERWLGDETDTNSLERAEGDIGEKLGDGGSSEVDRLTVLTSSLCNINGIGSEC